MPEKLKLRVSQLPKDSLDADRVEETLVYHWNRIVIAFGVLLAMVAVLVWAGLHFLEGHPDQPALPLTAGHSAPELPQPQSVASQTAPAQPSAIVPPASAPLQSTPVVTPGPNLASSASTTSLPEVVKPAPIEPVVQPRLSQAHAVAPGKTATPPPPLPPVKLSHHVSQLQLTAQLVKKQPTDNLGNRVNLNGRSLVKVYLYSQLDGLKGQRVYHEWFHAGKRMARIEIRPYLQSMNASSSKYLTPAMTGRWTVKVVDHEGHLLAERHFRVVDR